MLKVYKYSAYVSIDGADWRLIDYGETIKEEELTDTLILDNTTFDETYEYLSNHTIWNMWKGRTLFRKKPMIEIRYVDAWDSATYKHFKTLSYKKVYRECGDVSLKWAMEHMSVEQISQYLKERGITTCPMNF